VDGHRPSTCIQVLHERCKGVGIEEFICKPFRVEDLQRVVKNARRVPLQMPRPLPQGQAAATTPNIFQE
jgi:hypothetical protein